MIFSNCAAIVPLADLTGCAYDTTASPQKSAADIPES